MKFVVESCENGQITLKVPGQNYRNAFAYAGEALTPGSRVAGTISCSAYKAEAVSDGGNYVEPLLGRPRRMQGRVLEQHLGDNALTVEVGYPVRVKLPAHQAAAAFAVGSRIGWDNVAIPTFSPAGVASPAAAATH